MRQVSNYQLLSRSLLNPSVKMEVECIVLNTLFRPYAIKCKNRSHQIIDKLYLELKPSERNPVYPD